MHDIQSISTKLANKIAFLAEKKNGSRHLIEKLIIDHQITMKILSKIAYYN